MNNPITSEHLLQSAASNATLRGEIIADADNREQMRADAGQCQG
jgi:hypothetical protein